MPKSAKTKSTITDAEAIAMYDELRAKVSSLYKQGRPVTAIRAETGVSAETIRKWLKEDGVWQR